MKSHFATKFWTTIERRPSKGWVEAALTHIPAQELFSSLLTQREGGRHAYSISDLWVYLLSRLVEKSEDKEVSDSAFSRFFSCVMQSQEKVEGIIREQIRVLRNSLPEFGTILLFRSIGGEEFLLDGHTALPLATRTKRRGEGLVESINSLLEQVMHSLQGSLYTERCFVADATCDESILYDLLWTTHRIKPVIALKGERKRERVYLPHECVLSSNGELTCKYGTSLLYAGWEEKRNALKYRCLPRHYGLSCPFSALCQMKNSVRFPLDLERRLLTPIPRMSAKWEHLYALLAQGTRFERYREAVLTRNASYREEKKRVIGLLAQALLYAQALSVFTTYDQCQSQQPKG